jgi:hypothetical protein
MRAGGARAVNMTDLLKKRKPFNVTCKITTCPEGQIPVKRHSAGEHRDHQPSQFTIRPRAIELIERERRCPTKPQILVRACDRPFQWGFCQVSFPSFGLRGTLRSLRPIFSLPSLHPKIPFPTAGFSTARSRSAAGNFLGGWEAKSDVSNPVSNYCGFNPRASNCRLHSGGASRSRSTPMPRGKRPSTAARTRSGARNASDIVMLT